MLMTDDARLRGLDEAPRMLGHLPLVSAVELFAMTPDALGEIPLPCGLIPVFTPRGWRGMEAAQWAMYRRLCDGLLEVGEAFETEELDEMDPVWVHKLLVESGVGA